MAGSDVQAFIQQALEAQQQKLEAVFRREIAAIPDLLIDRLAEEQKICAPSKPRPTGPQSKPDADDMINAMLMGEGGNRIWVAPTGVGIMSGQPPPEVKEVVNTDMINVPQEEPENIQEETALHLPPDGIVSHKLSFKVPLKGNLEISWDLPEGGVRGWCRRLMTKDGFEAFVDGAIFSAVSSSAILANTIYMGWEASAKMHNEIARLNGQQEESISSAPEYVFTMFFVMELLMRVVAQRLLFATGRDKYWNFFDTVLIAISFIQIAANTGSNLSVFRIFRIFRLVRLLKVIRRVELLASLNLMVQEIVGCIAPLFWALLLLLLIMYAFGVFFVSVAVGHVQDISVTEYQTNEEVNGRVQGLEMKFGSMYKAITVLFEGVSGGNDWAALAEELKAVGDAYYLCFALYIVFVTLGVLNIVTGFFVDGTMQASMSNRTELVQEKQQRKTEQIQLIGELFEQLDTDAAGMLSRQELEASLNNSALLEYFCVLGMEPGDAMELFNLIDQKEGTGEVGISDFTEGCMRIIGNPKNLDIYTLLTQVERIIKLLENGVRSKASLEVVEPGALRLV